MKRSRLLSICFTFAILFVSTSINAATWTSINGRVLSQTGTPVCAMVLANGQYMYSCGGVGNYSLYVPLDSSGLITLQVFAAGFAPFRQVLTTGQAIGYNVYMDRDTSGRAFTISHNEYPSSRVGWVLVSGNIHSNGTPLCAMIIINGQSMFSCNPNLGQYSLEVPLDSSGNITLQAFVAGFQPYRSTFPGPSTKPFNQVQTERLIGIWDFFYTITSQWEDRFTLPGPAIDVLGDGVYSLIGTDTYGNRDVIAFYYPTIGEFSLYNPGITINEFFTFDFSGSSSVSGCYYLESKSTGEISRCFSMTGFKIGSLMTQGISEEAQMLHSEFSPGEKEALKNEEAHGLFSDEANEATSSNGTDFEEALGMYRYLKNIVKHMR